MRYRDLVGMALSALFQQKVRTLLTTLGVVFGTFVLVASLSVRLGVHETVRREYSRFGQLRLINVNPSYSEQLGKKEEDKLQVEGQMSAARRQRLLRQMRLRWRQQRAPAPTVRLTPDRLEALAALEHVQAVVPSVNWSARAYFANQSERALVVSAPADDDSFRKRLVVGNYLSGDDPQGVVVSEYLLYLLGVRDEQAVRQVVGKQIRLEIRMAGASPNLLLILLNRDAAKLTAAEEKLLNELSGRLPEAFAKLKLTPAEKRALGQVLKRPQAEPGAKETVLAQKYVIRGVLRLLAEDEGARQPWANLEADVVLPVASAAGLFFQVPANRKAGFGYAAVVVDSADHVKEVTGQIRTLGLQAHSLIDLIEREQLIYLLIFTSMTVIAGVSLLVAALGITNTMLMSVLERVREIGIMKALGARDSHIQMMFLIEGALVGLVGGLLGLVLGWSASFPGDAWVRDLVQRRLSMHLQDSIFAFPWWLVVGAPSFACLVTTLGALYPARRAARVQPVQALRHD